MKVLKVLRGLLLKKSPKQGSGQSPEVLGFGAEPEVLGFGAEPEVLGFGAEPRGLRVRGQSPEVSLNPLWKAHKKG